MLKANAKPIETLLEWDGVCREFGCSESQIRELYSAPCPDAAPVTESYDDVMAALRMEAEQQQSMLDNLEIKTQN